jgi:hypothetical protein
MPQRRQLGLDGQLPTACRCRATLDSGDDCPSRSQKITTRVAASRYSHVTKDDAVVLLVQSRRSSRNPALGLTFCTWTDSKKETDAG